MKKIIFLSFLLILISATTVAGQKTKTILAPTPTPVQIFWDYGVSERDTGIMGALSGERQLLFEMSLGKKSLNKELLEELIKSGVPIRSVKPNGLTVAYPEAMDDCHILADATKAAKIVLRYLPKQYVLRFNLATMKKNFYQTLPKNCGGDPGAARFIAALPLYIDIRGLEKNAGM